MINVRFLYLGDRIQLYRNSFLNLAADNTHMQS